MARPGRKHKSPPPTMPGLDGRVELRTDDVDDPYNPGGKIVVIRNSAESPLRKIFDRGRLAGPGDDPTDAMARLMAGESFRAIWERASGDDVRGIDYTRVKVDISFVHRGIPDNKIAATKRLGMIRDSLGPEAYAMVRAICGEQRSFFDTITDRLKEPGTESRLLEYNRFRDALDALIAFFGVARGQNRGINIRACREIVPVTLD